MIAADCDIESLVTTLPADVRRGFAAPYDALNSYPAAEPRDEIFPDVDGEAEPRLTSNGKAASAPRRTSDGEAALLKNSTSHSPKPLGWGCVGVYSPQTISMVFKLVDA
jgi:hypothetical protein